MAGQGRRGGRDGGPRGGGSTSGSTRGRGSTAVSDSWERHSPAHAVVNGGTREAILQKLALVAGVHCLGVALVNLAGMVDGHFGVQVAHTRILLLLHAIGARR